jgi:hypothetical protein
MFRKENPGSPYDGNLMAKILEEARKKEIKNTIREAERKRRIERIKSFGDSISPYDTRLVSELFGLNIGDSD